MFDEYDTKSPRLGHRNRCDAIGKTIKYLNEDS